MNTPKISSIIPKFFMRKSKQVKTVNIPNNLELNIYDKLINMQDSFNYIANRYGITFGFNDLSLDCAASVVCKKGSHTTVSSNINAGDDETTIAKKVNHTVSRLLRAENKSKNSGGINIPNGLSDELRDKFMSCKGTIDYYAKKYDVNFSLSSGESFVFISCTKDKKEAHTVINKDDSDKESFQKITTIVNEVK